MKCKYDKCKLLSEFWDNFNKTGKTTKRDYWIFTELFVEIHNGKDYCEDKNDKRIKT